MSIHIENCVTSFLDTLLAFMLRAYFTYLREVKFWIIISDKDRSVVVDVADVHVEIFARTWIQATITLVNVEQAEEMTNVFILKRNIEDPSD